jgi:hypothetical protein
MSTRLASTIAFALIATPAVALADGEALPRTIGVDAAVVLPLGDYSNLATVAFGALAKVEIPVANKLAVTGRIGALYHITTDEFDGTLLFFPVYGGVKYSVGGGPDGVYVAGELGITIGYASADTGFGTASDTDSELGMTLGAGFKNGALDLRGALFIPDLGEIDDPGIMGSVGYDFSTF